VPDFDFFCDLCNSSGELFGVMAVWVQWFSSDLKGWGAA
jgi:hypothetical protein